MQTFLHQKVPSAFLETGDWQSVLQENPEPGEVAGLFGYFLPHLLLIPSTQNHTSCDNAVT